MCDGRKVYRTASNGRRYLWTSEGYSAWVCEDGSWLEYGSFGRDTWGLHLAADGWRPVNWC